MQEIEMVVHETVLYLDAHPNSKKALDFYKKSKEIRDNLYEDYVKNFAPLYAEDVRQDYWSWIDSPWPWQKGKEA
ncbi:MAG: spore coat protein CotJB [Clostridia bacterium]